MQQCCDYKIRRFKAAVAKCGEAVAPVEKWSDGVPDNNEVQIGGRPAGFSPKYYAHVPTSACATSKWREIDVPQVVDEPTGDDAVTEDALTDVEVVYDGFFRCIGIAW